ncbi:MAG: dihydroorotate dehydrogenase electron transfer subunit [Thermodesulfovibrionales bacterium]|nr:dihydroorotate dehydrogenase electron transfer subunit [Thermodesulfovibrionales bacterium]
MDRYFKAEIKGNYKVNPTTAVISFSPKEGVQLPQPGQFYMIQVSKGIDPLLKRPLSIFSIKDQCIHLLYKIVGRGTECLSKLPLGETIELIGPLGIPYPTPNGEFIAIAGGTGVASIHGLIERFSQKAYLFYGARSVEELIMTDSIKNLSYQSFFSTDDGSYGIKGTVIDALDRVDNLTMDVYACGPHLMLSAVINWARQRGLRCYVSLEEYMACGVGACLSCVVRTNDGLKSVCKDGPVFNSEDIVW